MTSRTLTAAASTIAVVMALPAAAQTPREACALDSLRLVSPAAVEVALATSGRFGAELTWPTIEESISTCAVVVDTSGSGIPVSVDGIYVDKFDRELICSCIFGGDIGSVTENSVLVSWANRNQAGTGRISGEINLSNNGGILAMDGAGEWRQVNNGLPMYLSQVNVIALAEAPSAPGTMLAALTDHQGRGLWYKPGADSDWRRLAADLFPDLGLSETAITSLAFSPDDQATFLVGTSREGVFLTRDAGLSFTRLQAQFSPTGTWSLRRVTDIVWSRPGYLFVAISNLGLFVSTDRGQNFSDLSSLRVSQNFPTGGGLTIPTINRIVDQGWRLLVGIDTFGLYASLDNGASWTWLWDELLDPGAQPVSVTDVAVDPAAPQLITVGTTARGIWRTVNGGQVWDRVGAGIPWPIPGAPSLIKSLVLDEPRGIYLAAADGLGLLTCARNDTSWFVDDQIQVDNKSVTRLFAGAEAATRYWLATYGGGIYIPNTPLRITDTIKRSQTDPPFQDLEFGLTISFGIGAIPDSTSFSIVAQNYQGYAVWRSDGNDLDAMQLVGLYDRNNSESCIEGYCGDISYFVVPNCFADKRAACFDFSTPGYTKFFDDTVYEGFEYYYAVTTFDYGNTAMVSPSSLSAQRLYSTRFPGDQLSNFPGASNRARFFVARPAVDPVAGPDIFVFPNPLRLGAGFTGEEGEKVTFKNLPPRSHIRVFTLDGDKVADLGPERQIDNLMPWVTRNDHGDLLAPDVYIYKVEMPEREDFFGKLIIIR